jgi:hypothetical protein
MKIKAQDVLKHAPADRKEYCVAYHKGGKWHRVLDRFTEEEAIAKVEELERAGYKAKYCIDEELAAVGCPEWYNPNLKVGGRVRRRSQLDIKYLQAVGATIDALAKDFSNPVFAQFKPVLDKLSTDYKTFLTQQQQQQTTNPAPTAPAATPTE